MMFDALLLCLLLALEPSSPTTRPATGAPVPEWVRDPVAWRGFTPDGLEFAQKKGPEHLKRWQQYRALAVTPVTDGPDFRRQLDRALRREAVYVPDVPSQDVELRGPAPTTRPAAPHGPMTHPMFDALAAAVQDAWTVLQDRPFDEQRGRYFAGRVPRIDFPEAEAENIEQKLGERVDAAKLTEEQIWKTLRRLYDQRRAAFDGGFNLAGAALDSPRGLACQIFHRAPGKDYADGILLANGNASGTGWDDYWRAGLLVCARQLTHPPVTQEQLIQRDGRVLRADVQVILELRNGERAPMVMTLFYDPREKRWWVNSCCFTSSPFVAVVGQAR